MRWNEARGAIVVLIGAVALGASQVQGEVGRPVEASVYRELAASPDGTAFVMVMLKPVRARTVGAESRALVKQIQDRVLSRMVPGRFSVVYRYRNFPALAGRINAAGLDSLALSPDVAAVGPDGRGSAQLYDSARFVNADEVYDLGYTGKGITVAVLDTGIDTDHPDLSDNIAPGGWHFLLQGGSQGPGYIEDYNGHGTNVSGIITSGDAYERGVAPDTDILSIKVLYKGTGYLSDWAAGVDHVVSVKDDYENLCAINMSLESYELYDQCPCDSVNTYNLVLGAAIQAAKNAGIVTFACSGNQGDCTHMGSPACLSAATAVAAVYHKDTGRNPPMYTYQTSYGSPFADCFDATSGPDELTCFSNRSVCNDLAAPGRLINSTYIDGGFASYTGTSQATPFCTAIAALMAEKAGSMRLTPDQIVQILKNTGVPTTDPCGSQPNPTRVDALAAINATLRLGDANGDGLVDILDYGKFMMCLSGPGGGHLGSECRFADFNNDDKVDLVDYSSFQGVIE